jgi:hypothetical protein
MKSRAEIDALCWKILEEKVPRSGPPPSYPAGPRPGNFVELAAMIADHGDFEHAWSGFLHNFYLYKSESFFAVPPPKFFAQERRVWFAAVAEYLSLRFHLPVPAWTEEPEYFLSEAEEWDFEETESFGWAEMTLDLSESRAERRAQSDPAFSKRRIIFDPRALITL